jgi:uncharacterized protein (TIGR02246 family)
MRRLMFSVLLLAAVVGAVNIGRVITAGDKPKVPEPRAVQPRPAAQPAAAPQAANSNEGEENSKPKEKRSPEDAAIRAIGKSLVDAYQQHDAKAFAALFTANGEYVDENEALFHGREEIENEFAAFFKANPDTSILVQLEAARPIAPGVVKVPGGTSFRRTAADQPAKGRCSLVCVKEGEHWRIASLREVAQNDEASHHEQLRALEWMLGEWVSEGQRSEIHFSCHWDRHRNFLIRDFLIRTAEGTAISGTQRIGYDPVSDHLKTWIFDSDGGFSDGYFQREGANWVLHTSGITAGGQMAAGTEIFTPIDEHHIAWDSVDRFVGGTRIADSGKTTIVRKPPAPAPASAPRPKQPSE